MTTTLATDEAVRILSILTTRDHAGQHFTAIYDGDDLAALEAAGYIEILRPVHMPSGVPYSQEHWVVEVTSTGFDLVHANPESWDESVKTV